VQADRLTHLSGANALQVAFVAGLYGFNFLCILYLQRVAGCSPLRTSFAFLPIAVALAIVSLGFAARLIIRHGGRNVMLASLLLVTAAPALQCIQPTSSTYSR
jgi:hypothetical protein